MWLPDTIESQNMGQPKRAKVTRKSKGQRGERKNIPSGDGASPTHERPQKKKMKREVCVSLSPEPLSPERPQPMNTIREVSLSPSSPSPERPQTKKNQHEVTLDPSPQSLPPGSEWDEPMWDADGNRVWPGTPAPMVLPDISGLREAELSRMENVIAEAKSAVNRSIEECTRRQLKLAVQIERATDRICER